MAQPDISQILAALAQTQPSATPQAPTPQHAPPTQPPPGYPPGMMPGQLPNAPPPPTSYLPQPSSTGNIDLSGIKPVNSGSVSIADAIAKARHIAENRGIASYDSRQQQAPRDDPRLANRGGQRSRSRSPPRRDNYNANPYRDERREDPRRGSYRRSPSPDRNFRGARDPPAGQRGNDGGEVETIRVKSALVGLIIGRNGENLRKVETESGARVQFIQAADKHVPERQCTISGPLRARESAKAAIFSIIEDNGGTPAQPEKGSYTAGMPGRAKVNLPALRDGEASTQIMVPDKTVGLIIGRGGETIKDLQERSGCHVNIVGENKSVSGLRPVNLIGSERATAVAKEMILEIVESDNRDGNSRGASGSMPPAGRDQGYQNNGRAGGGGGGRDHVEKTIRVPSEAVGMIIGKGGETIKDMQRSTGCKINVNQPKPPDVHRDIDLAGSASAMEEAERVIWEKVETVRERDAAAGRGGGGGQGGGGGGGYGGGRDQGASQYGAYSQPQQAPAVPGYGQYGVPQAQPAWPQAAQQATPQPGAQSEADVYAAQQWYAQWVAMAQQQQQQQQPPGGQ